MLKLVEFSMFSVSHWGISKVYLFYAIYSISMFFDDRAFFELGFSNIPIKQSVEISTTDRNKIPIARNNKMLE